MAKVTSKGDVRIRVDTQYRGKGIEAAKYHLKEAERNLTSVERTSRATSSSMIEGWQRIKSKWLGVAASALALKKAWDFAEEAAKFKQTEQAFTNMAASHGVDAQRLITDLKRVSAQTISTAELMKVAGNAMVLGIPAERLTRMMEIARASSRITGQTIQKSFEDIALGVGRQSQLILDNLGIVVRLNDAYKNYAASAGKTVEQLTEAERKQAFLNAVMQAGEETTKRVNVQALTMAEQMARIRARLQDAKIFIGKVLLAVANGVGALLNMISAGFAGFLSGLAGIIARMFELASKLPLVGSKFKDLSATMREFSKFEKEIAEEQNKQVEQKIKNIEGLFKEANATTQLVRAKKELASIEEAQRKKREKIYQKNEQQILQVVLATEKLTASKERLIQTQAWEYAQQGATIEQVQRYVQALRRQAEEQERIKREKEARRKEEEYRRKQRALEELARLEERSPYRTAAGSTEIERIYFEYDQKLRALQEFNARKLQLLHEAGMQETELARQYAELRMVYMNKEQMFRLQMYVSALGATSNFFQNLYVATGSSSKKLFELQKAFSIAQAIMDTYAAANKAMASLPWPLSMAAAAATIAAGMARVRQIMALKPSGATGTISASGVANPAYRGGSPSAYPPATRTGSTQIKIEIQNPLTGTDGEWERLVEERIAPAIKRAVERNVEVI